MPNKNALQQMWEKATVRKIKYLQQVSIWYIHCR